MPMPKQASPVRGQTVHVSVRLMPKYVSPRGRFGHSVVSQPYVDEALHWRDLVRIVSVLERLILVHHLTRSRGNQFG